MKTTLREEGRQRGLLQKKPGRLLDVRCADVSRCAHVRHPPLPDDLPLVVPRLTHLHLTSLAGLTSLGLPRLRLTILTGLMLPRLGLPRLGLTAFFFTDLTVLADGRRGSRLASLTSLTALTTLARLTSLSGRGEGRRGGLGAARLLPFRV